MHANQPDHRLGHLINETRHQRGLSSRQLAALTGIPQPTIVRLETGEIARPNPQLLTAIAEALHIPTAELYALAGYTTPSDLPALSTYLRTKYRDMPGDDRAEVERFVAWIQDKHGASPSGPRPGEDEST